jgi:hypothetical protein
LPWQLGKNEVVPTISRYKSRAGQCYALWRVPGLVKTVFTILPSGEVESLKVEGVIAGTAEAECFVEAFRNLRFPPFGGPKQTIQYPFMLR